MIPARPAAPPPRSKESISDKISRLRREEHAASQPRLHHAPPQASTSAPRWLAASPDDPAPSRRPRHSDPRRGTAGPAPPPSWTSQSSTSNDLSSSSTSSPSPHDPRRRPTLRPRDFAERRKLAQPLAAPASSTPPRSVVDSLFALAGGVLAADLSRARTGESLLAEHVAYLPNHVRVRLVNDVFADWRNPTPLTDEGARELLRTDVSDGVQLVSEGEGVEGELGRLRLEAEEDEGEERGGWEDDALAAQDAHLVELVDVLDLSFAHVSTRTLRSLLLRPVGPVAPPPSSVPSQPRPPPAPPSSAPAPPLKVVSAFPHLHTLTLTATPRLALADPLFDLLAHLVSLRHLSLAGKHLDGHASAPSSASSTSATAASFLPRLAAATPTLRTLDLSWLGGLVVDAPPQGVVGAVRGVDWDARWGELRVLGLRGAVEEGEGEEEAEKERTRRDVREVVMLGRQRKKRRWIDVVV
ncbi:hypothetical protein JCM8208_006129 [Rhodotorula glutinis]